MKKIYSLLLLCGMLFPFINANAEVGEGVIKIKTNKPLGQGITMTIFIAGVDKDGDIVDETPELGKNFSIEGANVVSATAGHINMTTTASEFVVRGDIGSLTIVGQEIVGIDIDKSNKLYLLRINENPITSIDISQAPNLKEFWASYCTELTSVNLGDSEELTSLSLQSTKVASLNLSKKTKIEELYLGENPLLKATDFSMLSGLRTLWVNGNTLDSLDVSNCPELEYLDCSKNNLTTLNLSQNARLEKLFCWGNNIQGKGMDQLIESLPVASLPGIYDYEFCVYNKLYAYEHNILSTKQAQDLKARAWQPKEATGSMALFFWVDYDGQEVTGIETASTAQNEENATWYDLSGRRIEHPTAKGIYIRNGKKVMIQ